MPYKTKYLQEVDEKWIIIRLPQPHRIDWLIILGKSSIVFLKWIHHSDYLEILDVQSSDRIHLAMFLKLKASLSRDCININTYRVIT